MTITKRKRTPEIRYNLKEPKSKKSTLIFIVFRYEDKRLKYSTRQKIIPNQWDKKRQWPRSGYKYYQELKGELEKLKDAILETYNKNPDLSVDKFKSTLDIKLEREIKVKKKGVTFIEFIDDYIERKTNLGDLKASTIKKYTTIKNKLVIFQKQTGNPIDFEDITLGWMEHYLGWIYKSTKTSSQNTVNKDFGVIKLLMRKSHKEGWHTNIIYADEDFGVSRAKTSKVALTEEEVQMIYDLDLTDTPRLEKVRDWFLVACYSSMRFSDFMNIEPENIEQINGDYFIHTWTKKTNEEIYVPVNGNLVEILEKYKYKSEDISSQKFNKYIKEVCELAGITSTIIVNRNEKGKPVLKSFRKCDVISSHDGRRAWASINYLKGYPIVLLMQVTGHRKETTFLSYIGISKKELAIKLMERMKGDAKKSNLRVV